MSPAGEQDQPGTLTSLIEEVVRSASGGEPGSWTDGLRTGAVIGRYELLREVGRGGFGVVWEARDRDLGRIVAFKALRAPGEAVREKRLLAEAEVAARLSHPNIVTVLDVGRSEHGVYLVQEFLSGQPLSKRLAGPRLTLREALRIGTELARGLAHAHAHGVVHRDLTPGNVHLCEDGQVKIVDLGMASALGRRKLDGGTPDYMAPEQARAEPEDERTDIFALGVILYRMVTGSPPYAAERSRGKAGTPRGLHVPEAPALARLIEAMLAWEPTNRPRDAAVVLSALGEIGAALPTVAEKGPSRARVRPPPRIRWMTTGALAALPTVGALSVPLLASRGARSSASALVVAASSASTPCSWMLVAWHELKSAPSGAVSRNGRYQGQEAVERDGRGAWLQRSDWNQLFVPLLELQPDTFAVEASFYVSQASDRPRAAKLMVFTDPGGPDDSDIRHGRGLALQQDPGGAPFFEWGVSDGMTSRSVSYKGPLPSCSRTSGRLSGSKDLARTAGCGPCSTARPSSSRWATATSPAATCSSPPMAAPTSRPMSTGET